MSDDRIVASRASGWGSVRSSELQVLLENVAAGSQADLALLYDQTSRQVFSLALRIIKDRQIAEDVVLDVFLQIWRRARNFDSARGRAFGWILTITRSRALDALRSRTVRIRGEEDLDGACAASSPEHAPPDRAAATDRHSRVAAAIAELPAEQALALELAYFQGLSHTEIAARLGLSLGTIKTRIRLGMLKLREKLKIFEDEP